MTHKALEDAARKATPGKWAVGDNLFVYDDRAPNKRAAFLRVFDFGDHHAKATANAAYIAIANPTAVLALLEELSTLKAQDDALQGLLLEKDVELARLLTIAQGFDDNDRDYERINNLAGCENNHWRTQLRLFKESITRPQG